MIPYHQISLADVFTETREIFKSDQPEFLKLLESSVDLSDIVNITIVERRKDLSAADIPCIIKTI